MQDNEEDLHEGAVGFVAAAAEQGEDDAVDEPPVQNPPLVPPPPVGDDTDADDHGLLDAEVEDDEFEFEDEFDDDDEFEDEDEAMDANVNDGNGDEFDEEWIRPLARFSDDGQTYSRLRVIGFRRAAEILASTIDRRPITNLDVVATGRRNRDIDNEALLFGTHNDNDDDAAAVAASFDRFVTLLGLPPEQDGRFVKNIELSKVRWSGLPNDAVERLFHTVLPGHPTLRGIQLYLNDLPVRFVRMLTESIPTTGEPITMYVGSVDEIDQDNRVQVMDAVVTMLRRNAAVDRFAINFELDSDECQRTSQSLVQNTNLTTLHLRVQGATAQALDGFANAPSLQHLYVMGSYADDGAVSHFTTKLRTNATLEVEVLDLTVFGYSDANHSQALLDLVKTYSYTLDEVRASNVEDPLIREQFDSYRARNRRIRSALGDLPSSDVVLTRKERLAPLLGMVSDVPTVLQRFVKRYYTNVVSERLLMDLVRDQGQGRRDEDE